MPRLQHEQTKANAKQVVRIHQISVVVLHEQEMQQSDLLHSYSILRCGTR